MNKLKRKQYARKYYLAHKKELNIKNKTSLNAWRKLVRDRLITLLGGKCNYCGYSDRRALVFDHIKGDGYLDIESRKNKTTWYNKLFKDIEYTKSRLQVLCANCNMIKARESKEYGRRGEHK